MAIIKENLMVADKPTLDEVLSKVSRIFPSNMSPAMHTLRQYNTTKNKITSLGSISSSDMDQKTIIHGSGIAFWNIGMSDPLLKWVARYAIGADSDCYFTDSDKIVHYEDGQVASAPANARTGFCVENDSVGVGGSNGGTRPMMTGISMFKNTFYMCSFEVTNDKLTGGNGYIEPQATVVLFS